jgi:hypothetical protein
MIVNGVGRNGKNVNVDDDFLIHIPYGWCYDIDENALEDEQVFMLFHPENMSNKYTDGRFDLEDDTNCEAILKFIHMSSIAIPEDATELDIDINKTLKQMSVNAKNTTINTIFGGIFGDEDDDNKDKFHRMYEVVKDNPFLKVGYFTSGLLGRTVYNVILITSHYVYTAMQIKFPEDNCDNNQKILNEILSAIEPLNVKKYPKFDEQKPFLQPSYLKKHNVKVGSLTMMIPDGFEYVTENHIPQNDSKAKNVLDNYTMVVAPADCKGGLRNFRDASLGINISKAEESGLTVSAWKNIDAIKDGLNSNT